VDDAAVQGSGRIPRWPLALARIYAGTVFAVAGVEQIRNAGPWSDPGQSWAAALHDILAQWAPHSEAWYHGVLTQVLLPHVDLIAPLVAYAHVLIGVALVLGLTTRLAAALAIGLLVNYMAASGSRPYSTGDAAAYCALALAAALAGAGRVWGIDAQLARRRPSGILW
jgi:uncharacterized membrane protein YphA (DoxX/SURF4 family)